MQTPAYVRVAGTGALYFLAGMAGLSVPFTANNVSPVWLASGVALSCLLLFGRQYWPAVAIAAFLVNFFSPLPALAALGLAFGNTLAALLGVFFLQRISGFQSSLTRLKDMLGLIVLAAALSSTVSASIGTSVLCLVGVKNWANFSSEWFVYYLGDAMGILLVAPLLLALRELRRFRSAPCIVELSCLLVVSAFVCRLLFGERLSLVSNHTILGLLVFPLVLWGAIRFGVIGTALVTALVSTMALIATAHGLGPFAKDVPFINALLLQLFFATIAISGLLLSAVVAERQQAEAERVKLIRQQAIQEAEQESEKRYRRIVEVANEGIWTLDAEARTTFINRRLLLMLGYQQEEMLGRSVLEFCEEVPSDFLRGEETRELCFRRKDGGRLWVNLAATPIPDEQREPGGMLMMLTDITERKLAEEEIRKNRTELQEVLDNSPALIYMKDQAGRYTFVNRRWTDNFKTTADRVRNKTDFELFPHEAARQFTENDRVVMASGETHAFEEQALLDDGLHSYQSIKVALRNGGGSVYALCGMSTDITERRSKEESLRKVHRALRVLSHCNSAVVHANDEQTLLNKVCRVAVGPAGYQLAWVGYLENDDLQTVRPVASAGPAEGFLDRIHVSWGDNAHGQGSVGRAIRSEKPVVVRGMREQRAFEVWRNVLSTRDFESVLAVPLRDGGGVFGVLAIYATESDAFDSSEVELIVELGDNLAHGIESLRARKERTEAEAALTKAREELEERVRQRTAELVEARDAAESADRLKSAFLATMSHELRTPLNSIIGFTGIVLQGLAGPLNDEQKRQLAMVQNSSRHLLALINDVLDISKIEAGQLEIHCSPFPLPQAIEKAASSVLPLATKKGLVLRTEISPEVEQIVSDQRRTEQILLNLLSNAVKFTDAGSVDVRCCTEGEWAVISVRDTGIGIEVRHLQSIFEPFRQVDTGLARSREGTGLGLSICKRLVEKLGGFIFVESVSGQGSIFTIRLPLEWKNRNEEHSLSH